MAIRLDGKKISGEVQLALQKKVKTLKQKPGLAVVLIGEDPASKIYVNNKDKACQYIGYNSQKIELPATCELPCVLKTIEKLNNDKEIHGILVQAPLPKSLRGYEATIIRAILPQKDVDCFHPENIGNYVSQRGSILDSPFILPCTPAGIMRILKSYSIQISGKHAVVIGRSPVVGKPTGLMLLSEDATVTMCHSKTPNIEGIAKTADILVAAIGIPKFITAQYVKKGAVVIDVGINRTENGLMGDVDFDEVEPIASAITPVPGGIGPMTVAMLMENVMKAYMSYHPST